MSPWVTRKGLDQKGFSNVWKRTGPGRTRPFGLGLELIPRNFDAEGLQPPLPGIDTLAFDSDVGAVNNDSISRGRHSRSPFW